MWKTRTRTILAATVILTGAAIGVAAPSAGAASCATTSTTTNYGNCTTTKAAPAWHCVKRNWYGRCTSYRWY